MWAWIMANWKTIVSIGSFLIAVDAERRALRLYLTVDWKLERLDGNMWKLTNDGWLTEHDIRVESPDKHMIVSTYPGRLTMRRHESVRVFVGKTYGVRDQRIIISSKHLLGFRHSYRYEV